MYPILFTLFGYQITSFGIFLIIAILSSLFVLWRLARVYELDSEKILDIFFLTAIVSLIGSRVFYVATHLDQFESSLKMILFFKYAGLSFWGAVLTGVIALRLIAPRLKMNFWQIADLGIVAVFLLISIISFGCLFGGCQYGTFYDGWFAVNQFGIPGTRFPLQLLESGLFILGFIYFWHASLKFHFNGKIVSIGLITLALIKLALEPLRGDPQVMIAGFRSGILASLLLILIGLTSFYRQSKRSFRQDIRFVLSLFVSRSRRKLVVSKLKRSWYNFFVQTQISTQRWQKNIQKQLRVKSTPTRF